VDAILDATGEILGKRGYASLSVRAISDRAGVSVGSLYQYFDSKEALVRGLSDRDRMRLVERLGAAVLATRSAALKDRVEMLVAALLEHKGRDPELSPRLTSAMIEIEGPCYLGNMQDSFVGMVRGILGEHEGTPSDELTAFVVVQATEGVLAGLGGSKLRYDDPRVAQALVRLVMGFLSGPG
jgi:AcrR family transcriptional regulator